MRGGDLILEFDLLRALLVIPIFIYACYTDIRERRVSNNLWIVSSSLGLAILSSQFLSLGKPLLAITSISFILSFFLSYLLISDFLEFENLQLESYKTILILLVLILVSSIFHLIISFSSTLLLIVLLLSLSTLLTPKAKYFIPLSFTLSSILVVFNALVLFRAGGISSSFLISFLSSFTFGYLLYLYGIFGGADAKALWSLSIIFPYYPTFFSPTHPPLLALLHPLLLIKPLILITLLSLFLHVVFKLLNLHFPLTFPLLFASLLISFGTFPLSVLFNAVIFNLLSLFLIFLYFFRNMKEGEKPPKPLMVFYATQKRLDDLIEEERKRKSGYSRFKILEKVSRDEIILSYRGFDFDEKDLIELRKRKEKVWVTYGVPFMVPLTAGLIFAIFLGDLVTILIVGG